jgi:hypothetical protein
MGGGLGQLYPGPVSDVVFFSNHFPSDVPFSPIWYGLLAFSSDLHGIMGFIIITIWDGIMIPDLLCSI